MHAHLQRERSGLHVAQLQLEPIEACPPKQDPSSDVWRNVGGLVDEAAQVRKLHCLLVPLACCFE